jgi:AbiV family abortive infection protein
MFARAFALACTALEEIGKSQIAADVYTGFLPHEPFEKAIRDHQLKSAYTSRSVQLLSLRPITDLDTAERLFDRRNDALYASPDNEVQDSNFDHDATTMIRYCDAWLETIARTEQISERIGTRGFMK